MRKLTLALLIFASDMFAPPYPPHADKSVTEAATFLTAKMPEVSPQQRLKRNIFGNIFRTDAAAKFIKLGVSASPRGSQNGNRRRRQRRVRRVVYRKPPTVWVLPDVIQPMTQAEGERVLRWAGWVTWF